MKLPHSEQIRKAESFCQESSWFASTAMFHTWLRTESWDDVLLVWYLQICQTSKKYIYHTMMKTCLDKELFHLDAHLSKALKIVAKHYTLEFWDSIFFPKNLFFSCFLHDTFSCFDFPFWTSIKKEKKTMTLWGFWSSNSVRPFRATFHKSKNTSWPCSMYMLCRKGLVLVATI